MQQGSACQKKNLARGLQPKLGADELHRADPELRSLKNPLPNDRNDLDFRGSVRVFVGVELPLVFFGGRGGSRCEELRWMAEEFRWASLGRVPAVVLCGVPFRLFDCEGICNTKTHTLKLSCLWKDNIKLKQKDAHYNCSAYENKGQNTLEMIKECHQFKFFSQGTS